MLDASVALGWLFLGEETAAGEALLDAVTAGGAVVPSLWPVEIANALAMAVRRGRMTEARREIALGLLRAITLEVDRETPGRTWSETLPLADRHRLTAHDATYLALALRRRLPLATRDAALRGAAEAEGIAVLGA